MKKCKDVLWKRWEDEYLRALREKQKMLTGENCELQTGEIVQIKDENKNRGTWKLGVVTKLIKKDDVTLGAKLKTKVNKVFERPITLLYPLELKVSYNMHKNDNNVTNGKNVTNDKNVTIPKRNKLNREAKCNARDKIKSIYESESESD